MVHIIKRYHCIACFMLRSGCSTTAHYPTTNLTSPPTSSWFRNKEASYCCWLNRRQAARLPGCQAARLPGCQETLSGRRTEQEAQIPGCLGNFKFLFVGHKINPVETLAKLQCIVDFVFETVATTGYRNPIPWRSSLYSQFTGPSPPPSICFFCNRDAKGFCGICLNHFNDFLFHGTIHSHSLCGRKAHYFGIRVPSHPCAKANVITLRNNFCVYVRPLCCCHV